MWLFGFFTTCFQDQGYREREQMEALLAFSTQPQNSSSITSTAFYSSGVSDPGKPIFQEKGIQLYLWMEGVSKNLWTCFKATTYAKDVFSYHMG